MSLPTFVYDLDAVLHGQRPHLPEVGETARLDGAEGRHAVSVKRIVVGERNASSLSTPTGLTLKRS